MNQLMSIFGLGVVLQPNDEFLSLHGITMNSVTYDSTTC